MIKISNPDGNIDDCFDNPEYSQNIQIGDEFDGNIEWYKIQKYLNDIKLESRNMFDFRF